MCLPLARPSSADTTRDGGGGVLDDEELEGVGGGRCAVENGPIEIGDDRGRRLNRCYEQHTIGLGSICLERDEISRIQKSGRKKWPVRPSVRQAVDGGDK